MGLTNASVGIGALGAVAPIRRQSPGDRIVALAGNPNVGKSTVFNALTGMNQHTGNWPGKTVTCASGTFKSEKNTYIMVDLPGTYSLMAHSAEEMVARNFICFGNADMVTIVCDATCLERNLNLVLQTLEVSKRVLVCVNLMDEAEKKHIRIDLSLLSSRLGVPVIGVSARKKKSLASLVDALDKLDERRESEARVTYTEEIETAIGMIEPSVAAISDGKISSRFLALKLLDSEREIEEEISSFLGEDIFAREETLSSVVAAREYLAECGITSEALKDLIVSALVERAEEICRGVVICEREHYNSRDMKLDRILTGRITAYPFMLLLLALVFFITISAANYPSELLSKAFFALGEEIDRLFCILQAPDWLRGIVVDGVYRVLTGVIAVMLPPMAIFFPLFTLLEDFGYLPRIAYNLDRPFKCCRSCGKQALTMCMGFGCNAAGVVGCRIIDSPRERLLAIITNNFVPCNGRFPTLIAIITMFFIGSAGGVGESLAASVCLSLVILLGVLVTFAVTRLLSASVLRGVPSSFTLELPSYRRPQICRVIVRSIFDRTLFVLGRAAAVAAPAGALIWLMANITIGDESLLCRCADLLDPLGGIMGLDGVILIAFILGFPANEIVVPIIIMAYMAEGRLVELNSLAQMRELFVSHGWTYTTAICTMIFSLMHWPCSTTLITIKRETGSVGWTVLSAVLPTAIGFALCSLVSAIGGLFV